MRVVVYRKPVELAVEEAPDPYIGGSCLTAKGPSPGGQAESLRVPPLDQAPSAYEKFDQRIEGYTKVILEPDISMIACLDHHRRLSTTIIDKENRMRRWHR